MKNAPIKISFEFLSEKKGFRYIFDDFLNDDFNFSSASFSHFSSVIESFMP